MQATTKQQYSAAVADLRNLLAQIGKHEFKCYGYASQLRQYRQAMAVAV